MPVDQDPSVRDFLKLDNAGPAPRAEDLNRFEREFEAAAGLKSKEETAADNQMHSRSEKRAQNRPNRAALVVAGVATGAVLTVAAMNGMFNEADGAKKLADYDAKNKAENIANNPELFGQELPEDPSDMTISVTSTSSETDVTASPDTQLNEKELGS